MSELLCNSHLIGRETFSFQGYHKKLEIRNQNSIVFYGQGCSSGKFTRVKDL